MARFKKKDPAEKALAIMSLAKLRVLLLLSRGETIDGSEVTTAQGLRRGRFVLPPFGGAEWTITDLGIATMQRALDYLELERRGSPSHPSLEEERLRLRRERDELRELVQNVWITVGFSTGEVALWVRRALGPHVDTSKWTP